MSSEARSIEATFDSKLWKSASQQVNAFDTAFVDCPPAELFITKVIHAALSSTHGMKASGIFLTGQSGAGKSAILEECYRRLMSMSALDSSMPAILFSLEPRPTMHSLVRDQLRAAKYPFAAGRSFDDRIDLLFNVIHKKGIRAVLIDEAHHLIEGNGAKAIQHLRNLIKRELDRTNVCLAMAGLSSVSSFRTGDEQLESRINAEIPLTNRITQPGGRSIADKLLAKSPIAFNEDAVATLFTSLEAREKDSLRQFKAVASEAIKIASLKNSSIVTHEHVKHGLSFTFCK